MRGLSITKEGILAGDSYRSARSTRFAGNAKLIFLNDKAHKQKMPFSQVYDIVSLDYKKKRKRFKELREYCQSNFGPPLNKMSFADFLIEEEKRSQAATTRIGSQV